MQVQDTRLLHVACALMALAQPEEGGLQSASEGGRKALVKTVFAAIADPLDVLLAQELVRQRHGLQEPAAGRQEAAAAGQLELVPSSLHELLLHAAADDRAEECERVKYGAVWLGYETGPLFSHLAFPPAAPPRSSLFCSLALQ